MKTKLTISIDEKLLKDFNKYCDDNSLNKSKLICNFINKKINTKTNEM